MVSRWLFHHRRLLRLQVLLEFGLQLRYLLARLYVHCVVEHPAVLSLESLLLLNEFVALDEVRNIPHIVRILCGLALLRGISGLRSGKVSLQRVDLLLHSHY